MAPDVEQRRSNLLDAVVGYTSDVITHLGGVVLVTLKDDIPVIATDVLPRELRLPPQADNTWAALLPFSIDFLHTNIMDELYPNLPGAMREAAYLIRNDPERFSYPPPQWNIKPYNISLVKMGYVIKATRDPDAPAYSIIELREVRATWARISIMVGGPRPEAETREEHVRGVTAMTLSFLGYVFRRILNEQGSTIFLEDNVRGAIPTKPSRPEKPPTEKPPKASDRPLWYKYKRDCNKLGLKYTHKELAADLGLSHGAVRTQYADWLAEQDSDL